MYLREGLRKIHIEEDFYKCFFKVEQVYQKKMDVSDSMNLWWSILEKHSLNLCSVFSKGLWNNKVCALWRKSKFAETLLKYRTHKQGCFEIILQGGEGLHGQVMFSVRSVGTPRRRDASVQKFFTQWLIFPFLIKHVTSPYESYLVHHSFNCIKPRKYSYRTALELH